MNKSTLLLTAAFTLVSAYSTSAVAVEGLSANASVTNNYVWRGVSQTQDNSAVSGGIDYASDSGFSFGAWASNVDFDDDTSAEVDLYAGYSFKVNDEVSVDVGYLFYGYPGGEELDFSELYASVSWNILTFGYNVLVDSDWGDGFGDSDYVFADLAFEVADGLELAFHYGMSNFDRGGDYSDYGVSLSKNGFSLSVSDVDENAVESDFLVAVSYSVDFEL